MTKEMFFDKLLDAIVSTDYAKLGFLGNIAQQIERIADAKVSTSAAEESYWRAKKRHLNYTAS